MKKRIAAFVVALIAAIAFSQPQTGGFGTGGNSARLGPSFSQYAFFEFAPASGAGMGSACACSAVTGARGEAVTFTRTGSATCSRQGLATTGIANGDLVTCATDQPRVEPSGGVLGLRVEGSRTNQMLRSEQVDNAIWIKEQDAAPRAPTVTADQGVAPDGTSTADRVQFPATSGVEYSDYYQSATVAGSNWSCSVFVRGFSGSGTTDVCSFEGGGWSCQTCAFVSTSWSLCKVERATSVGTSRFCKVGNNSLQNGGVARAASDVLVWGHSGEEASYSTSYIPTVAAAVTRNAETATLPVALSTGADFSVAESFMGPSNVVACAGFFAVAATAGPSIYTCFNTTNVFRVASVGAADSTSAAFTSLKWNTGIRWGGSWNRTTSVSTAYTDGVAGTPSAATPGVTSVSWTAFGLTGDGIHSRVCADPGPARCR